GGAGGRVDRDRGGGELESQRRDRLGTGRDRLGLRGRLRAHLSGHGFSTHLASEQRILERMATQDQTHHATTLSLDDPATFDRADAHRVRDVLAAFPAQCRAAAALRPSPVASVPRPRLVVVAGMGGSASSGDLLAGCAAERLDVPVLVHRSYGLPAVAGDRDLVIATSYSGDTEEVLSATEAALSRGCHLVVVTSGGRLGALARER